MTEVLELSSELTTQFRLFLLGLSNEQIANFLYIMAVWSEEFVVYCYEHEETATDLFTKLLSETTGGGQ